MSNNESNETVNKNNEKDTIDKKVDQIKNEIKGLFDNYQNRHFNRIQELKRIANSDVSKK